MTISRHFEIIYLLLDRKVVTAKELSEHFEASTRTIYRDVDVLSGAGIPIYANKGRGGGISLLEGYSFNASMLTSDEQEDILVGLQTLAVTEFPNTDLILKKVARLFKKQTTNWIDVDFSPWGSGEKKKQLFILLRDAISQQFVVYFRYFNSLGEQSVREVEPIQLLFKKNAWYLSGYCLGREDFRIFKISRMDQVGVSDQTFTMRSTEDAIKDAEKQIGETSIPIKIRISSQGAYRVYDEFDDHMITKNKDGSYTVVANFPVGTWLDSYLLSFGTLIEDIHPVYLRERLLKIMDKLKHNLENPTKNKPS
ncbi:helix-turn-helix transcriptional regulator [Oceanobacillus picturae]|uniref:helix-turn-helix transcriptional regulator n=1 Tax=Oceanobacillus picturae TaxID=171693 RepID=UPI000E67E6DC|nr:YafY family protein [Oceanobacillus picturae]RIU90163.1 YafY family transcriptional regulator [Oceanobacillus picturae]